MLWTGRVLGRAGGGPAVSMLSNRFQEDSPSAGTVTQLEMEAWVWGEALGSGLSLGTVVLKQPSLGCLHRWS